MTPVADSAAALFVSVYRKIASDRELGREQGSNGKDTDPGFSHHER
jgi:hypothetical protein